MTKNRLHNLTNPNQGNYKKVLCVCSAGLLRSPTAAYVLSQEPYNFNTRAVGLNEDYALISIDVYTALWADEIICMEKAHEQQLHWLIDKFAWNPKIKDKIITLNIPDKFSYRDPELIKLIKETYDVKQNKD